MNRLQEIHEDSIYYAFKCIEERAYLEKIKFFEKNKDAIENLDAELSTEIWFYYAQASFEIGEYKKYTSLAEELLPRIINENIYYFNEVNVFETVLFHKGASHLNLEEYSTSNHIFSELIKIDKENRLYARAFLQNKFSEKIKSSIPVKIFGVLLIVLIILFSLAEMLIVNPFYPVLLNSVTTTRELLIVVLFSIIISYAVYHYIKARIQLSRHLNS